MEEEKEKKSSRDKVSDFIQNAQNARAFYQLGKRGAARAVARGIVAGAGAIGGPVAVGIVAVVFFTIIIAVITGGPGQASEVSPSINTGPVSASLHFYCQYDSHWTDSACNIAGVGCDPTSLAIVLSSFGRTDLTPRAVAFQNGSMGCSTGTTIPQIENSIEWAKSQGFTVAKENFAQGRDFDLDQAKKFIDRGYLLLGVANVTFKTSSSNNSGGHSFVITGVDPTSQNLTVLDPTYCTSDDSFTTRALNVNDVFCPKADECGWYYVHAIKK